MKGSFLLRKSIAFVTCASLSTYYYNTKIARTTMWSDNGNRVYAWGAGMNGQLGIGQEKFSVDVPTEVEELSDKNIVYISAWGDISAALSDEGEIYLFGKTKGGALGGSGKTFTTNLTIPTQFEFKEEKFTHVSVGKNHAAAVTEDGRVVTWGNPDNGKLGHGTVSEVKGYKPKNYADRAEIDYVNGALEGIKVSVVECGFGNTVALTADGDVYTWGFGREGALGNSDFEDSWVPKKIESLSNITQVKCGGNFVIWIDKDGNLYSFGKNSYGQLGMTGQNTQKESTPMKVQLSRLAVPSQLACGEEHCSLVTQSGNLWTWGYGNDGQLGQKNKNSLNSPKQVKGYTDIVNTACGGGHSAFILKNGELYMFGRGRDGQLGRGDVIESMAAYKTEPVRSEYLFKNEIKASQIALGANHSIALVSMGK